MSLRRAVALAALATLFGCEDKPDVTPRLGPTATATTPSTAMATAATTTKVAAPPVPKPVTSSESKPFEGYIPEPAFRALHELKGGAAPEPKGEMVKLSKSRAYLSLPAKAKPPIPTVIVIHEWWGLNGHIKHWADRLAADGYAALAVDLYDGKVAKDPEKAMELMKAVDSEAARKVLLDAFGFVTKEPRVKAEKRASIGWCFGGKWSLELALAAPELDAAVVYYGHVETNPEKLASLEAPLLAIFGNQDEGIPPKAVNRFEAGLEMAGGKKFEILRYDAKHAFANPSSERYDAKAAEQAWAKVRAFLRAEMQAK